MLTLKEKMYLLTLLRKQKRHWFKARPKIHNDLIEKLEQMVRNEQINGADSNRGL